MRKLVIALIVVVLLTMATVAPAFAIMDKNVPADERSGQIPVGGAAAGPVVVEGGQSLPIHDTNDNTDMGLP